MGIFSTNIDADEVKNQYEQEQKVFTPTKKTIFNEKNYLQARLRDNETSKTLTIRLLPFSATERTPFKKVFMHTVKVNKEVSPSGWKTFVCPSHNTDLETDGRCPFCETSAKARELKRNSLDEPTRNKYGDVEFMNRVKEMWIVRCIERGHEEDGVKFWLFNSSKKKNGPYDQIMNLANIRSEMAAKKGNKYSIFDLNNGLDLIITLSKTSDNKTSIQVLDSGFPSPITDDVELGESWIHDTKKWNDVYTVKPYDYMSIIMMGGVPAFDKDRNTFVDKTEAAKIREEAEQDRIEAELTAEVKDYSEIAAGNTIIHDEMGGTAVNEETKTEEIEDLPF